MSLMLIINPGSTSTKVALFEGVRGLSQTSLEHDTAELAAFATVTDQFDFRLAAVEQFLSDNLDGELTCVVGRGGLLRPMESGVYEVNEKMVEDLKVGVQGQHASNLGGLLALGIATKRSIPAYIVDPVAVDEFTPVARIAGIPQIERRSLGHALNIRAVARRMAHDQGKELDELNLLVAHLGGGISIAPLQKGRILDYNNANEAGPFSPERAGTLPSGDVVTLSFSGKYSLRELVKLVNGKAGMSAYLGTNNAREAVSRAQAGDTEATLILEAMCYQVGKEIGAMATVLAGQVDGVILTGGLAHAEYLTTRIGKYVKFIAPVYVYAGEDEMLALAEGAYRVLAGLEEPKTY